MFAMTFDAQAIAPFASTYLALPSSPAVICDATLEIVVGTRVDQAPREALAVDNLRDSDPCVLTVND